MGSLGKFPKLLCLSLLIDEWGEQYFPASECCYKDEVGENKPSPQHSAWGHSKQTLNAAWCVLMTENSLLPFSTCPLILGVPQSLTCSHFSVRYFILFYIILYFFFVPYYFCFSSCGLMVFFCIMLEFLCFWFL